MQRAMAAATTTVVHVVAVVAVGGGHVKRRDMDVCGTNPLCLRDKPFNVASGSCLLPPSANPRYTYSLVVAGSINLMDSDSPLNAGT